MSKKKDELNEPDPEHSNERQEFREIIGLGEFSARKSYYPELQQKIEELRESEARFRDFADSAADWFWEMGPDLRFSRISGKNVEIMGIDPKLVIGLNRQELYSKNHDLSSPRWEQHLRMIAAHLPFTDFEVPWCRPDGEERHLSLSGKPRFDAAGKFLGYRGVGRDVSDRHQTEQALRIARKNDAMFKNLVENITGAAYRCLLDSDWSMEYISQGIEELSGFPPEDFIASRTRTFASIIHPDDVKRVYNEVNAAVAASSSYILEYRIIHADGGIRWVWERGRACDEEQRQPVHLEGVMADITEQKQTELALRRAQKMDAVGQLTGGIAHDFNNILGIIIGNLDLLENYISDDAKSLRRVEIIRKSAQRAADLTRKLLGFSRQQAEEASVTDINQLIHGMQNLIARSVTPAVSVELRFADQLWLTKVDPGDFEDALINLVINAHDAMPGGGNLTLHTCNCFLDSEFCSQNPGAMPGDHIQLTVSDDGTGIPAELNERIFEPFFTTKAQGKGTGLGLAMVFGFVQRSGGFIKVTSQQNKGSSFQIYLPRACESEKPQALFDALADISQRGDETILLVDDEADLLELARESLQSLGYRVLTASDAREALKRLSTEPDIDLLCSDVVMPGGINGYELAEQATARCSELKVLLVSGHTKKAVAHKYQARYSANLLSKPYTQAALAMKVRTLLNLSGL